MPLTLQLYGSSKDSHGHLIIDRKNLIFVYSHDNTKESIALSDKNRCRIQQEFDSHRAYDYWLSDIGSVATEDSRHNALDHMSEYDRYDSCHHHIRFNENINFATVKLVFQCLRMENISDLISEDCRQNILIVADVYFSELKTNTRAHAIEEDYRLIKELELPEASTKVTEDVPIETTVPQNSFPYRNGMQFFIQFIGSTNYQTETRVELISEDPYPTSGFFHHQTQEKPEMKTKKEEATLQTKRTHKRAAPEEAEFQRELKR